MTYEYWKLPSPGIIGDDGDDYFLRLLTHYGPLVSPTVQLRNELVLPIAFTPRRCRLCQPSLPPIILSHWLLELEAISITRSLVLSLVPLCGLEGTLNSNHVVGNVGKGNKEVPFGNHSWATYTKYMPMDCTNSATIF